MISIIIPTYNEEKYIKDTVNAALKVTPNVIVVDDNSPDNTQSIVKTTAAQLIVKPSNVPKGKSASINYASEFVTTEYTIVIDADTIINDASDLIEALCDGADLVGAEVGIYTDNRAISRYESREYDFVIGIIRPLLKKLGYINNVSGAFLGIRTELLQANPVPSEVNGEDMYLTQIGLINNWDIRLSKSKATTYAIPSVKALLIQRARWITGNISVVKATGRKLPLVELIPYLYNIVALLAGFGFGQLLTGNGLIGLAAIMGFWYAINVYITKSFKDALGYLAYSQLNILSFLLSPILGRKWKVNR
jgi:cellulose synthase/poly-beta-1,6-N-acetylglucosamine synthase-like glycosyltransferase